VEARERIAHRGRLGKEKDRVLVILAHRHGKALAWQDIPGQVWTAGDGEGAPVGMPQLMDGLGGFRLTQASPTSKTVTPKETGLTAHLPYI
jgi:hypothetical protein